VRQTRRSGGKTIGVGDGLLLTPTHFFSALSSRAKRTSADSKDLHFVRNAEMISGEKSLNQFDGELAVLRHKRKMDALGESPAVDRVLDITVKLAEKAGLPPFMGLFRKALKLGQPSVEKMIDDLESAAYEEVRRIWERLDGQDERQRGFDARLDSHEAQAAYLSACFHGLRTSDPAKHSRLGRLTINCVFEGDLQPEGLDGMMRAAVELTEHDIEVLGSIYKMQNHLFSPQEMRKEYRWRVDAIRLLWEERWKSQAFSSYQGSNGLAFNSSCARLQSAGLIASIGTKTILQGPTMHDFELLPEGKKFHERLQEIAIEK
jgi:hypothetical protein